MDSKSKTNKKTRAAGNPRRTRNARATQPPSWIRYVIDGGKEQRSTAQFAAEGIVTAIEKGLPFHELDVLLASLQIPQSRLAQHLGVSTATLHRWKTGEVARLASTQSDRMVRYARLMRQATDVFESADVARRWLSKPQYGLGGRIPLEYAQTEAGAREVEDLLGRIDTGVYS